MKKTLSALALISTLGGCTPAQQALLPQIEPTILNDLGAGKTLEQIEADVAKLLVGQPGVDIVAIVNDAIMLLVDEGVIPANDVPKAKNMLTQIAAVRAAKH